MMKKILNFVVLAIVAVALTGCFGVTKPSGVVEENFYVGDDVKVAIPRDWEAITEFPAELEEFTLFAVRNNVKNSDFVANVSLTYVDAENDVNIDDFVAQAMKSNQQNLFDFRPVSSSEINIKVGSGTAKTKLNVFDGKLAPELSTLRVFQTYGYKNDRIYTITGMYDLKDEQFAKEKVETTVKSLEIK